MMGWLQNLFFPPKCASCGTLLDFTTVEDGDTLCKDCLSSFCDEQREICMHCLREVSACACVTELLEKAGCNRFYKTVYYRHGKGSAVQNRMIFRIKNKRDARTSRFFARELAEELGKHVQKNELELSNAVIAYVPRRRRALLDKGTDQAKALAAALSREMGLPIAAVIARRRFGQREQKTLSPKERMRNARASFVIKNAERIDCKTVLLVDDIVTTGASMAACAKKLVHAGAAEVICLAAASDDCNKTPITPPPTKPKINS